MLESLFRWSLAKIPRTILHWATIGIRLVELHAEFTRPPKMRENSIAECQEVQTAKIAIANYVIAVDDVTEFVAPSGQVMTRQDLRELCDANYTKAAIA